MPLSEADHGQDLLERSAAQGRRTFGWSKSGFCELALSRAIAAAVVQRSIVPVRLIFFCSNITP
ncbi:hypothetical protein CHELA17_63818 [Chelatococcus asaccharovorans]|nr:hypothetical protein CHELA17_63818 [Chelatococcus asaccharovorans]